MSISIALVCEGPTDPPTICALADRVIAGAIEWIEPDEIETHRHYRGFQPAQPYLRWDEVDDLAKQRRVKSLGHFNGLPLHGDGHNTRKALHLLTLHAPDDAPVDAIILFRDGDREYDVRQTAIRNVRDASNLNLPVVVGVANRIRECWLLNGFEPAEEERELLATEHQKVGFDPRFRAHELNPNGEDVARDPRRILRELTRNDADREHACLRQTSVETLKSRGENTGLKDYLEELEIRLIRAFR